MFLNLDIFLEQALVGNSQTSLLLVWFGIFCAKFILYFIPLHLLFLWFFGGQFERRTAVTVVASILLALFIGYVISLGFYRDRPFVAGVVEALMYHSADASFPSDHATIFGAYFTTLYLLRYKMAAKIAFVLMLLVCWGRLFTGMHYPTDIIAGLIVGALSAFVAARFVFSKIPAIAVAFPPQRSTRKK